ncbi:hypothetical protein GCM10027445_42010 [Amycolatopsis endophytica]|uniref:Uncharacterized protein n=1 Tax=Amycolatopsis endophytica TaxID=860233 RepID=A0A853B7C1_9PSEU|nr:hypothetical protein [Amycolatopsis endophytica]NYI90611.1 hypothetical protein [Amycolatopsis endophytica]
MAKQASAVRVPVTFCHPGPAAGSGDVWFRWLSVSARAVVVCVMPGTHLWRY